MWLLDLLGIKKQQTTFNNIMERCKRKEVIEKKHFRSLRKKHHGAR